jgi:hypothetical protein
MPQNCKISQRRLLLDQLCTPGFRSMPPTESKRCRPPIPISRKKWTPCRRNWWSARPGTGGRHPSESMVGMAWITQLAAHFEAQLVRIARGRPVRSIHLLYQSLLREPLKDKR